MNPNPLLVLANISVGPSYLVYVGIAFVGLILGPLANWSVYNLAYFPRNIGPWRKAPEGFPERTWQDWLPVIGWLRLRREASLHGKYFWIRPFLFELLLPIALCSLCYFEVSGGTLSSEEPMQGIVMMKSRWVHFAAHSFLIWLLMVATFIDFDERCIPDTITLPGSILALIGAATFPDWHFFYSEPSVIGPVVRQLHPASPYPWELSWGGNYGLLLAWLSFTIWCFSLADRRWIMRRGWRKAIEYFLAALVRHWTWRILLGIWIVGIIAIGVAFQSLPPAHWQSLFTSLIGMTLGCSVVWIIRIIAGMAMGVEAMGFGDVTLMAMVGAFLGWQPAWIGFFIAPIVALLIVITLWLMTGDNATPFGPYLAVGTVITYLGWDKIWNQIAVPRVLLIGGDLLFWSFLSFLVLLGGTLWGWLKIKRQLLH